MIDMTLDTVLTEAQRLLPENWAIEIYCVRGCVTVMLLDPAGFRSIVGESGENIATRVLDAVAHARGISTMQQQEEGE